MNNLKRVLSLGLTGAMLTGMMMVGASAAEFTDSDEIVNTDAVDTMVALNIINGKDDGSFDPTAVVTRAEMAKMITVALNGGKDPVLGTLTNPTYTDIGGHWAEKYIEYCSNLQIINGRGDGTFAPDATVTGTEAAKMVLVAMGYESTVFKFTGIDWATNVNVEANSATPYKLYDEIETINPNEGLSRDNAAQLIFNGIQDYMMEKDPSMTITNGEITWQYKKGKNTILSAKYGAQTFIGTFLGNENTGADCDEGEIVVEGKLDGEDVDAYEVNFPSDFDIANIGEEVKVIFKDGKPLNGKPDENDTIYGVFNTGNTTVYKVTKADVGAYTAAKDKTPAKLKIDGANRSLSGDGIVVMTNYAGTDTVKTEAAIKAAVAGQSVDTVKFVCDKEGKINRAYVVEYNLARVTGLTSSKITLTGVGAIDLEGNDVYEDVAKDDIVVYTRFYNETKKDEAFFTITKADSVEGEVTGYKKETNDDDEITGYVNVVVDDTTYKINNKSLAGTTTHVEDAVVELERDTGNVIGDTVRVYLINGMAAAVKSIEESSSDYAIVTDLDLTGKLGSSLNGYQATIMTTDGDETTYALHKDSKGNDGEAVVGGDDANLAIGDLVKFSISGSKLKIEKVLDKETVTKGSTLWNEDSKKFSNGKITAVAASNAKLFVQVGDKFYVYTLRDLDEILVIADAGSNVSLDTNKSGLVTVASAVLTRRPASIGADTVYGIVAKYLGTRKIDSTTFYRYEVETSDGETLTINLDYGDEDFDSPKDFEGSVLMFDETSNQQYDFNSITVVQDELKALDPKDPADTWVLAAGEKLDGDILSYFTGMEKDEANGLWKGTGSDDEKKTNADSIVTASDVKVVYINLKDKEIGDETSVAFDNTTGYANIMFHTNTKGLVDVIYVETSNEKTFETAADASKVFGTGTFEATPADDGEGDEGETPAEKVTIGTIEAPTTKDGAVYSVVAGAGEVEVGKDITVTIKATTAPNSKETVTVTYGDIEKTMEFENANDEKSVTFTAVKGQTTITAEVK